MIYRGSPSHLGAAIRLAVAGVRQGRVRKQVRPVVPGRKPAVERQGIEPSPERVRRYLALTGGAMLYPLDAADPVISPTYSAVWETALTLELLALEGMPFPSNGVLHLASELVVLRPLRTSDRLRCRLELVRIEGHSRGAVLVLELRLWNAAGMLCQQNETRLLVPGAASPPGAPRTPRSGSDGVDALPAESAWREVATWQLAGDAGLRYARASGDFNPIHLWPWSARLLGFSRPILHGHCILAMMAHAMCSATGDRTRKISARFRGPLELPATVRLEASNGRLRLLDGERRLVEGSWVGAAPPAP